MKSEKTAEFPHPDADFETELKALVEKHYGITVAPVRALTTAPGAEPAQALDPATIMALIQTFMQIMSLFKKK